MIATDEWLQRYIGYGENGEVFPMFILHPYKDCNADCPICYIRKEDNYCALDYGEKLSPEATERFVKMCARKNGCLFTGSGEPFLYWNEWTKPILLPLVKEYGARLVISTNGLWGSNDTIIDEVIELQPDCVSFSVDWAHATTVPLENVNHAIERLADPSVQTRIYMSQITDDEHPLGHIKPLHFDDMVVVDYPIGDNSKASFGNAQQPFVFHTSEGRCRR